MKKRLALILAGLIILGLFVCSGNAFADGAAEIVIGSILVDSRQTFAETKDDLIANGGENLVLGDGNGSKEISDEGLILIADENENPMFNLKRRLDEVDGMIDRNQAFHIKFRPSAKDFGFIFYADNNAGITIGDNSEPLQFVSMGEYMEPLSGNIQIEPGQWYHALLAMHSSGDMQVAMWKDGEENNLAGGYINIGSAFGDGVFQNQSWEMSLGFRGDATFKIDSYEYYTFSGFVMSYRSLETGENQNANNDYGPYWTINIAGNFDIMSDLVWQSIAPQPINAGGDSFTGYNLADLMNFSGNGSSRASVVFADEAAQTMIVEPTYDAFIVYERNGELLGGPYLLSIDGLSEYPVIEVHPE